MTENENNETAPVETDTVPANGETTGGEESQIKHISVEEGAITLEAFDLVKIYRRRRVVDMVDLRVTQGKIVGLLGPNGAGKTTSFYMMVGLISRIMVGSSSMAEILRSSRFTSVRGLAWAISPRNHRSSGSLRSRKMSC